MNGNEFLKKAGRSAKAMGLASRFEAGHGKGSHGRLYVGSNFTTLKDRKKEIGPGLLNKTLKDLGLTRNDI